MGLGIYHSIYYMRDIKYKGKCIKMSEDTWLLLKERRKKSGLSWNLFLLKLLDKNKNEKNKKI